MRTRKLPELRLVRTSNQRSGHKRAPKNSFDLPGDTLLDGIYWRRLRCLSAVKEPVTVSMIPSPYIALIVSALVYFISANLWLFIGAFLALSVSLWFVGALTLWQFVYRKRLSRECWELQRFASEHRLTHERFRHLWSLSVLDSNGEWPLENDLPKSRFDRFAEKVVAERIPALQRQSPDIDAGEPNGP